MLPINFSVPKGRGKGMVKMGSGCLLWLLCITKSCHQISNSPYSSCRDYRTLNHLWLSEKNIIPRNKNFEKLSSMCIFTSILNGIHVSFIK